MQSMMSAQTVLDSVNKYRHGVLIGNFVEDQFGIDLANKGPHPDLKKTTAVKQMHDLSHSLYRKNQIIDGVPSVNKTFYDTAKQKATQDYLRPQKTTTYNIFHQPQGSGKLENNPKKEQHLQKTGQLYEQTRTMLANGFGSKESRVNKVVRQQIPDILTGEIMNSRKQLIVESQDENRMTKTRLNSQMKPKSVNPYGTYSIVKPEIKKLQEVEYKNLVMPNPKGEKRDILFGHGLALDDFQKRQLGTSYDLSFNQKVKPQTQVNSFYEPGLSETTKHFHKDLVYEKNYQAQIPAYGNKASLHQEKLPRPYGPYTKTYDQAHLRQQYLRK